MRRRQFLNRTLHGTGLAAAACAGSHASLALPALSTEGENLPAYIRRVSGGWDDGLYQRMMGAANDFKEGDAIEGVAATDQAARQHARELLARTFLREIDEYSPRRDDLFRLIDESLDRGQQQVLGSMTLEQLKEYLLEQPEQEIRGIRDGLSSDVIACVVRLMTNEQLIQLGARLFDPLPGTQIGARGYLGARIQPNSPTDNVDDIRWQVLNAFSYAVGDVLLGTNPVSSDPESVHAVQRALQDILMTFGIDDAMPHCVLAHIDVQAEVEAAWPGSTELWFQSIAGNDAANATFDISIAKMIRHARSRTGRYALYFETGQGADFTNGHGQGLDMVLLESRKYGFARALKQVVARSLQQQGNDTEAWVHLNDVAGFIGPEVFRTREQLVRCCLEDIVMGKLHGLTIGLDVCSTLHMDVTFDDLEWCLEQIVPANPAYLMALPTRIDPMLGYLTTGFQDHVRIREQYGFRVNDRMWQFFQQLEVIDELGRPTEHFGSPSWVYLLYCRAAGDPRSDELILEEARLRIAEVRSRGVFIAEGSGRHPWTLEPALEKRIRQIDSEARRCIWMELTDEFAAGVPDVVRLRSRSLDRTDYILHPQTGEQLKEDSLVRLKVLRKQWQEPYDVQLVISDGLNARALMEGDQLLRLITGLTSRLAAAGLRTAPAGILLDGGRVRAGYRIGEYLFAEAGAEEVVRILQQTSTVRDAGSGGN